MVLPVIKVDVVADTTQATDNVERFSTKLGEIPASGRQATRATRGLSGAFRGLSGASATTRNRIQQVGFQVQDIVVQLQGGTSATVALSQQLPQLASAFGAVGAIIGTGIGLAIPALSAAMAALGRESIDLEESLDDLSGLMGEYIKAAELSGVSTSQLSLEFANVTREISEAADALERFTARNVQNQIDTITAGLSELFGVAGGGEARGAIADFFDVDIFLAFTDAQRAARDEARLLTDEFLAGQRALAESKGNIDAQVAALSDLLFSTERLAEATGGVSAAENELIGRIAAALNETERHRLSMEAVVAETSTLEGALNMVNGVAALINATASGLEPIIRDSVAAAGDLVTELVAAGVALDQATRRGGGRGADPRLFGFGAGDLATIRLAGGAFEADPGLPGDRRRRGGRGGRGREDRSGIESLINTLQTEQETIEEFRTEGLELLMKANEQELEVLGGFNEAKLRLEKEYQDRLRGIKQDGLANDIGNVLQGGQEVLSAIGQTNERALALAKAFGAANSLINAYSAYTQVLADPTLPFFAKFAAAASVFSAAIGAVNSIRSVTAGGGGGGAGGGAGPGAGGAAEAAAPQTPLEVRLSGIGPADSITGNQLSSLFDRLQDEAGDRGLIVSFAT